MDEFCVGDYIVLKKEYFLLNRFRTRKSLCKIINICADEIDIRIIKGEEKNSEMAITQEYYKKCNINII